MDPYFDFAVNDPFTGDDDLHPAVSYPDIDGQLFVICSKCVHV